MQYQDISLDDTQTVKLETHELGVDSEYANNAFEKCMWFFGLYLSSVFTLTVLGVSVRWILASL